MKKDAINSETQMAVEVSSDEKNQNFLQIKNTSCNKNIQDEKPYYVEIASIANEKEQGGQDFIKKEAEKLCKITNILIDSAVEVVQSRVNRILDDRDILFFADDAGEFITVEQLLTSGDKYNKQKFLEPLYPLTIGKEKNFIGVKENCWFKFDGYNPTIIGNCGLGSTNHLFEFKRIKNIKDSEKFRFIKAEKLSCHHANWLIDRYIESEKVILFFGAPASFKSFVVIDMGLSIATGEDWHGHSVTQGGVLYVCGEGQSGIKARITAWEKHHNKIAENFYVSSSPVQILSEESLTEIEVAAKNISDATVVPKLIIIDTLNRNFGDGDENSTLDMTKFIKGIDRLSHNLNCTIIIVHHSGLSDAKRSRGSSALLGAIDFEYSCKVENGSPGNRRITLNSTKTKDHTSPEQKVFEPLSIQIDVDDDGNPISSLALVETSMPANVNKLSTAQRIALDALKTVINNGDSSEDAWKTEAYAQNISSADNPDAKRKAFDRAKKQFLDQGLIDLIDGSYKVI